ncbi:MAG: acyl carrier protein [Burkholderiaceae bacterium]
MTTLNRLQKILMAHYPVQAELISRDAKLEQLDIDSLGLMELFFAIEDEFGISVPNDQRALRTVGDLVDYIDTLQLRQPVAGPVQHGGAASNVRRTAP